MNTVIDLPNLSPRIVIDRDEIVRLRWFQIYRYFESGLLDELPTRLPNDPTVEHSTYFAVYGDADGNQIHATARIIHADSGLPLLEHHSLYPNVDSRLEASPHSVGEISGLAVGSETPHYRALALLSREFLRFGLRHQEASLLIASIGQPLMRILNRLMGIPVHVIGPTIDQYGTYVAETTPVLIDTVECLQHFRNQHSRRWEFFVDGLVIDLTDSDSSHVDAGQLVQVAS